MSKLNSIFLYAKECESIHCINNVKYYEGKKCYDCIIEEDKKFIPIKKQKICHQPYVYDKKSNLLIYDMDNFNKNIKEPKPKMFSIEFLQKFYNMKV